jgi:hypothetical protein
MALTQVNRGTSPNDNTASTLYDAFGVVNTNFSNLSNVDNTTDLNKPISTATQTALNLKAPLANPTITGTLTTVNDAVINSVKIGRGGSNIANNTVVGNDALSANTFGQNNTAVGVNTLKTNTDGISNTAIGSFSMEKNTVGDDNVGLGTSALYNNTTGNNNTATGSTSLYSNTTGFNNSANGFGVLYYNTTGINNSATGVTALRYNTSGNENTATGSQSLYFNSTGYDNTANGVNALYSNTIGYNNTAIGVQAGSNNVSFYNITCLGYNAQVNGSDQIQLGSGVTTCYTYGALNNRSDLRDKTEVRDTVLGLDFINSLRAVDYKWDMREDYKSEMPIQGELSDEDFQIVMDEWLESVKLDNITHDGTHTRTRYHHGLIAQEVQDIIEASGVDFGGFQDHSVNGGQDVLSIGYTELIAPMIKAIQELTARINLLENN